MRSPIPIASYKFADENVSCPSQRLCGGGECGADPTHRWRERRRHRTRSLGCDGFVCPRIICMQGYVLLRVRARPRDPLLPYVPRAVVLTMERNTRLTWNSLAELCSVCTETWIQVNRGWKENGVKPDYVRSTAHDLVHAYRHACEACAGVDGPVLFFEEDALLLERDRLHYERVDAFLRRDAYDVYSLGSFGEFGYKDRGGHHRRFVGRMGFSQAIVWSKRARDALLARPPGDMHIDVHTLSEMERKYSYMRPLVVQLFPTTENMSNWCIECNDSVRERLVVRMWTSFLQRVLHLDCRPDGWRTLYRMNDMVRHIRRSVAFAKGACVYALGVVVVYLLLSYTTSASKPASTACA